MLETKINEGISPRKGALRCLPVEAGLAPSHSAAEDAASRVSTAPSPQLPDKSRISWQPVSVSDKTAQRHARPRHAPHDKSSTRPSDWRSRISYLRQN